MNQPQAAGRNFQMFARSLEPLLDAEGIAELRRIASSGYESNMREAMRDMWAAKLGLSTSAIHSIGAASVGSSRPSAAPQVATKAHEAAEALWKGLSALLGRTPTDWTLLWRQLADVADAAANGADDDAMVGLLEPAFYAPLEEEAIAEQWRRWLRRWRAALQETRGGGAASLHEAADSMRRTNPKFVPREWMLVEAYTAAERGEYAPLHGLMAVLRTPYAEHPEAESRFYRRAPLGAEQQGGIGFMS